MNVIAALAWVWLGLAAGISLIETPLKFRAPGITRELGLGIGRLVFKAVNIVEWVIAIVVAVTALAVTPGWGMGTAVILIVVALAVQTAVLRGPMDARAQRIVGGETLPASSMHLSLIHI